MSLILVHLFCPGNSSLPGVRAIGISTKDWRPHGPDPRVQRVTHNLFEATLQ